MNLEEAKYTIDFYLGEAYSNIKLAEQLADEHGISFPWDLAYGMGGSYIPNKRGYTKEEALKILENADEYNALSYNRQEEIRAAIYSPKRSSYYDEVEETGWRSSTSGCS